MQTSIHKLWKHSIAQFYPILLDMQNVSCDCILTHQAMIYVIDVMQHIQHYSDWPEGGATTFAEHTVSVDLLVFSSSHVLQPNG